ncbi:MAG: pitrilysin family protein [Bacteroidota bacterium]
MIEFSRHTLDNGLRIIVHEDDSTPLAAVNILYNVGARNERPEKTGFAHLFEHLMFGGSENVPSYDEPLQWAGGESNAFTNNDITNYYNIVPSGNLETAFWLESDRMMSLNFNNRSLDVQRKVVVEEFKENYLNQPYGDAWHNISDLAFKVHPYRWPTIGLTPDHVENASLDDVKAFFFKFYRPNNAILVVTGNVKTEEVIQLAEKWFGEIPRGVAIDPNIPVEPEQKEKHERRLKTSVPLDAMFLAFHMPARIDPKFYYCDLLTDILATGNSSRLYRRLLMEQQLFSEVDAYVTGSIDPGLLIIEGKPSQGVSLEEAEAAVWKELEELIDTPIPDQELQKIKNKVESTLIFSEASVLNKAINLAFFELLGDADIINREPEYYRTITSIDLQKQAKETFRIENCSRLYYEAV